MVFNSFQFIVFFPIVTLIYFIIPSKLKWIWLLITSYYFYMSWDPRFAILILISTVITYFSGILIEKANCIENVDKRKNGAGRRDFPSVFNMYIINSFEKDSSYFYFKNWDN